MEPQAQSLRLGDLLNQEDLGLRLVTRDTGLLDRSIAGAHALESPLDAARWLDQDWVMLTAGFRLGRRDDQRELIAQLHTADVAALGFTTDVVFKNVPSTIIEEAERHSLAVFSVPFETPFRQIISFVSQSLLSRELHTMRRAFSMNRYLMGVLAETEPERALVERLASLLQSSVMVMTPEGSIVASQGSLTRATIWRAIGERPAELQRFRVGRWSVISMPVSNSGATVYWLVVATQSRAVHEQLAKSVVEAAGQLLSAINASHRAALVEEQALRAAFLQELIDQQATPLSRGVRERLGAYGFSATAGNRIAVIAAGEHSTDWLFSRLQAVLQSRRTPALMIKHGSEVIVLIHPPAGNQKRVSHLLGAGSIGDPGIAVGIGRPIDSHDVIAHSLRDARLALEHCRRNPPPDRVVGFENLDPIGVLLGSAGVDQLGPKASSMLDPLLGRSDLMESLVTYFELELDVTKAATALHLHPNSLRYRISKIEEVLGLSLRTPSAIANVYLALEAAKLIETEP